MVILEEFWKVTVKFSGHLIRSADSLEKTLRLGKIEGRRRRGWQRMRWLDGIIDSMDMKFEQALGDGEGLRNQVYYSPWGHKSWTWLSDWTTTIVKSLCTLTSHIYQHLPFMKISSSSIEVYSLKSLNFNFIHQDVSTLSLVASVVYYFNWIWHNTFLKSFTLGAYNLESL